jgi:hypothetical protein
MKNIVTHCLKAGILKAGILEAALFTRQCTSIYPTTQLDESIFHRNGTVIGGVHTTAHHVPT